ncbi:MAG: DUF11 domain-containing protein [Verrucomicrobia bacterium]|jgi:uncharacterized repeat protein (TIGR01451 family)|nr:DUF11 domain-containing protein [Verrucomicrobiota bacterium]
MKKQTKVALYLSCLGIAVSLLTGCQSTNQQHTTTPPPKGDEELEMLSERDFGPSYKSYEEKGVKYTKGSMAFPTGIKKSSGLLLEKVVPTEVMAGKPFTYVYQVRNLTEHDLHLVTVTDMVTENFSPSDASPKADTVEGRIATWQLGELGPKQVKEIVVTGVAKDIGTVVTCGWASYSPVICEPIKVVKANISLVKTMPSEALICDPLNSKLVVQNTGGSTLTGVKVTDTLPAGLSAEGKTALSYDVGTLKPGESKEYLFAATASKTGKFVNTAKVTSNQGVEAEATAQTVVRKPVLQLTCKSDAERFVGRPFNVCLTVASTGDATAADTMVSLGVPAGATFKSATAGGVLSGNEIIWRVGDQAPKATKELCATLVADNPTSLNFSARARGACADQVTTTCQTKVVGIPAILLEVVDLDDPIEVGSTVTYVIKATNQGSAADTGIKVVCTLESEQQFVSGSGTTTVSGSGDTITMAPVASLAPKEVATWRVNAKALKAKNIRFSVSMTSDNLTRPVTETESTNQY